MLFLVWKFSYRKSCRLIFASYCHLVEDNKNTLPLLVRGNVRKWVIGGNSQYKYLLIAVVFIIFSNKKKKKKSIIEIKLT